MHYASLLKDDDEFEKRLKSLEKGGFKRCDIHKLRCKIGHSPIHLVARVGLDEKRLDQLLGYAEDQKKAVILSRGKDGMTVLHLAVKATGEKSKKCFKILIAQLPGTPPTMQDVWGREPLHLAANRADQEMCNTLLMCRGAVDPEKEDDNGYTPLRYILENNTVEEDVRKSIFNHILQKQGAGFTYKDGRNLLHMAAEYGSEDSLKHLVEVPNSEEQKLIAKNLIAKDASGRIPLHIAILAGRSANAIYLLSKKPSGDENYATVQNNERVSAIAMACNCGLVDVAKKLLEIPGGDVNSTGGYLKNSLLHFAVDDFLPGVSHREGEAARANMVQFLLDNGANLEAKNGDGQTPLILACCSGFRAGVQKILDWGKRMPGASESEDFKKMLNHEDREYGQTALEWACEKGWDEIVDLLLESPAVRDLHSAGKCDNFTALHFVIWFDEAGLDARKKIVKALCDKVPRLLEVKDKEDRTPITMAENYDEPELLEEMLKNKNTGPDSKLKYLRTLVQNPMLDRLGHIPEIIRSFEPKQFGGLVELGEEIAKLGHTEPLVAWMEIALEAVKQRTPRLADATIADRAPPDPTKTTAATVSAHVEGQTSTQTITAEPATTKSPDEPGDMVEIPFSFAIRECPKALKKDDDGANTVTKRSATNACEAMAKIWDSSKKAVETKFQKRDSDGWSVRDWAVRYGLEAEISSILGEKVNYPNRRSREMYDHWQLLAQNSGQADPQLRPSEWNIEKAAEKLVKKTRSGVIGKALGKYWKSFSFSGHVLMQVFSD
jgi:uncharacterized protein